MPEMPVPDAAAAVALLNRIWWQERWLELESEGSVDLPAYTGTTLRGALGAVMLPELCERGGQCGEQCELPARCRFYTLFEQSRAQGGKGSNTPKPFILEAPLGESLRTIAHGGSVEPPWELLPGQPLPILANDCRLGAQPGGRMALCLRALGSAGAALNGVVEGIRRRGLDVSGGRLRLAAVQGGRQSLAIPVPDVPPRRLRVALVTPTILKADDGYVLDPVVLGRKLLDQALVRAVSVLNTFFLRDGDRIPFIRPEWPGIFMTGHRLFHYRLRRRSYRQGRWMEFDGVVGWIEWEGDLTPALPWLRAAELLHIGQKATFGLGKVEIVTPDSQPPE
jgi:hypothetical protein